MIIKDEGSIMTLDEAIEILENEGYIVERLDEEFTMGVGAPLGADQGIPHSMDGCAVPMMRLGDPPPRGKPQHFGPPPRHRMNLPLIGFWGPTRYVLVKPKKRKKKKKKKKS